MFLPLAVAFFYATPLIRFCGLLIGSVFFLVKYLASLVTPRREPKITAATGMALTVRNGLKRANRALGFWEYAVGTPRNLVFGLAAFIVIVLRLISFSSTGDATALLASVLFPLLIVTLLCLTSFNQIVVSLKAVEFLRMKPEVSPDFFFKLVYDQFAPFPPAIPEPDTAPVVTPEKVSFHKDNRSHQGIRYILLTVIDTAFLAHASLKTLRYVGRHFAREVFDLMAAMWGKRVLQAFRAGLTVTGKENVEGLNGKFLLLFNHKSQLDFGLTFFALSHIRLGNGRGFRPRFITARDHFLDNPLVYSVMGIGKLIESVDMVFIDRKSRKGFQNLKEAAEFLARKEIDIAIYPQGTRAEGNVDRSGKRRDAGFYTTVPPKDIDDDLGHLRKGAAYLAVDTLMELAKGSNQDLHLVFVGLSGTATSLSKQSAKVQTETDITYHIGKPLTLSPLITQGLEKPEGSEATTEEEKRYLALVNEIHDRINYELITCLNLHEHLAHRYLVDLKGHVRIGSDRVKIAQSTLEKLGDASPVPYQILDRIYALAPDDWGPLLSEFTQLLLDGASLDRFRALRQTVTQKQIAGLKKKSHGKKVT